MPSCSAIAWRLFSCLPRSAPRRSAASFAWEEPVACAWGNCPPPAADMAWPQELAAQGSTARASAGCQAGSPMAGAQQRDPHAAYLQARSRHLAAAAGQLPLGTSWGDALGLSGRSAEESSPESSPRLAPALAVSPAWEPSAGLPSGHAALADLLKFSQPAKPGEATAARQRDDASAGSSSRQQAGEPCQPAAGQTQTRAAGCQTDPARGPSVLIGAACQEILRLRAVNEQLMARQPTGEPHTPAVALQCSGAAEAT